MNKQSPILLCHAACTGGTLIFRKLCEQFSLWGLSEVSHYSNFAKNLFYPFDPEALMYANGWISEDEFAKSFGERLAKCDAIAQDNGKRLLIREHTHSLFFKPTGVRQETGFSWINDRSEELFKVQCPVICTLRDPVDSWLGIKHSFRSEVTYTFDEYCERYLVFFEQVKEVDENRLFLIRYEDFLSQPQEIFQTIAEKFNLTRSADDKDTVLFSGNSGRQSVQMSRRPRRAYSTSFIRAVENSKNYLELTSRLGYEDCRNEISNSDRFLANLNSVRKLITRQMLSFGRYGNQLLKGASVPD